MHVRLVPLVDHVDHPAVRHLTSAVGTTVSGSVVILAGPLHSRLPADAAPSAPWGSHA
ncbi:UNVERIFIED_CONTAM: hypothetical protein RKD50_008756 [Streptomyces canus]